MYIESAVIERIRSMTPKGSDIRHYEDDGITLLVDYHHNGKDYRTRLASMKVKSANQRAQRLERAK